MRWRTKRVHVVSGLLALTTAVGACAGPEEPEPGVVSEAALPAPPARRPIAPAVLWVGGDVLTSRPFRRAMRAGGDPVETFARTLAPTTEAFGDGFVLLNLEAPVARELRVPNDAFRHLKRGERRVRAPLNAPRWFVEGLARAGVDGVMLANNHTLDQHREGLAETIDAARVAGLAVTGAGFAPNVGWPIVVGDTGGRITVLTYFERDLPEPALDEGVAGLSVLSPLAAEEVRVARQESEAVVVVVHVVHELRTDVKPRWREWTRELVDAGADAVLLHGQHVPAPVEEIVAADGRPAVIAYGLGNFISDMGSRARPERSLPEEPDKWDMPETREGLVARVELRDGRVETSFLPIFVSSNAYLVYNRVLDGPPQLSLLPLSACGVATSLPDAWASPQREELIEWIGARRDHLLATTGLAAGDCAPGVVRPLRP